MDNPARSFRKYVSNQYARLIETHCTEEIRTGYGIWLIGMIPFFVFVLGTQILTTPTDYLVETSSSSSGSNATFLSYLAVIFAHNIICWSLFVLSLKRRFDSLSRRRQRYLKIHALVSCFLLASFVVVTVSLFDLDIEYLSHQIVYAHAQATPGIALLMEEPVLAGTYFEFLPFSVLPMLSILVAYWAVILIGFEISALIVDYSKRTAGNTSNWQFDMEEFTQAIKWCFVRVLVILITSSSATAIYFLLGAHDSPDLIQSDYVKLARGMATYWGLVFSLMMVFVFSLPIHSLQAKLAEYRHVFAGYTDEDKQQIMMKLQPYGLLRENVQYAFGFLMPFLASFIGPLFS